MRKYKKYYLLLVLCVFTNVFSLTASANQVDDLFRQPHDPVIGNPQGKITVVEFFDYQCSYCIVMSPVIEKIIQNNKDVRVVLKEFPIRGQESELAAKVALAANKQGKYSRFNHALLTSRDDLTPSLIMQIAKRVGLDMALLQKDLNSPSITQQIKANFELADRLNVEGTPAFFIGRTNATDLKEVNSIYGAMSLQELQDVINKLR